MVEAKGQVGTITGGIYTKAVVHVVSGGQQIRQGQKKLVRGEFPVDLLPEAPAVIPVSGIYTSEQLIYITSEESGVEFRYTIGAGTLTPADPTESSQLYSLPFSISSSSVIKVAAFNSSGRSPVVQRNYTINITPNPPSTRLTIFESVAEIEEQRRRLLGTSSLVGTNVFKVTNVPSGSNNPGDGDRTLSRAKQFVDDTDTQPNKFNWAGPQALDANGKVIIDNGTTNEPTGNFTFERQYCAAKVASMNLPGIDSEKYFTRVAASMLAIVGTARIDWGNQTLYPFNYAFDRNPGFFHSRFLDRFIETYALMKAANRFTLAQKRTIDTWLFKGGLLYVRDHLNTYFNGSIITNSQGNQGLWGSFENRLAGSYRTLSSNNGEFNNGVSHVGGFPLPTLALHYNNRRIEHVSMSVKLGLLLKEENNVIPGTYRGTSFTSNQVADMANYFVDTAKVFFKESMMFGYFHDGTCMEMYRGGSVDVEQGWYYSHLHTTNMAYIAELLARNGDRSLMEYSTREGRYGTECSASQSPKDIFKLARLHCQYATEEILRYETTANSADHLINGVDERQNRRYISETRFLVLVPYAYKYPNPSRTEAAQYIMDTAYRNRTRFTRLRIFPSGTASDGAFLAWTGTTGSRPEGHMLRHAQMHQLQAVRDLY